MNCIIFTGGKYPEKDKISHFIEPLKDNVIVIAADSGLDAAKAYDIKPDFFLGDMDSVNAESLAWFKSHKKETAPQNPQNNIETFPEDKDFSDTELALHKAKSLGADFIALIGGSGGRLDHLLGILELFKGKNAPDLWLAEENAVVFADAERRPFLSIDGLSENAPVSVFPVFKTENRGAKYVCKSENLVWPLDGLDWKSGAVSLSNRRTSSSTEPVKLEIESGSFIVIVPLCASFSFSAANAEK